MPSHSHRATTLPSSAFSPTRLALGCALIVALGCGGQPAPPPRVINLADRLPITTLTRQARLDLGSGSDAERASLVDGWSLDERWNSSEPTFVWSSGKHSSLHLLWLSDGPAILRFRCMPLDLGPGNGGQIVTVAIDGKEVGRVALRPDWAVEELSIPAGLVSTGDNTISFAYSDVRQPLGDSRLLAVAWDWVELVPRDRLPARAPLDAARVDANDLAIPFGTQLDYYLELPASSVLRWDASEAWGRASGSGPVRAAADITWRDAEATRHLRLEPATPGGRLESPLRFGAPVEAKISLFATAPAEDEQQARGVLIRRPVLELPGTDVAGPAPARTVSANPSRRRPNVLVYLVDTLRADHLGAYGYRKPTSPALDAFARDAVLFERALAQSGWTRSAVASVLTGKTPFAHGVLGRETGVPAGIPTLPTLFAADGYATVAVITNPNVSASFGFAPGWDEFVEEFSLAVETQPDSATVNRKFYEWLDRRPDSTPFLAYLHTMDVHHPYVPGPEFRRRLGAAADDIDLRVPDGDTIHRLLAKRRDLHPEDVKRHLESLYDAAIAQNDARFGELLSQLRARGLYDDTIIVFLADHGEEFLDHGEWGHGHTLYPELLHIPLLIKLPGNAGAGARISSIVQQVDLLPTLLRAVGVPFHSEDFDGRDLWSAMPSRIEPTVHSMLALDGPLIRSVVHGRWQLIRWNPQGQRETDALFDLDQDPGAHSDCSAARPEVVGYLLGLQSAFAGGRSLTSFVGAPRGEVERSLRALGYLR